MAKAKDRPVTSASPADDVAPAFDGGFEPAESPAAPGDKAAPADPRDAEIERLKAELAAAKASGSAGYPAGQKFRVTLTGGATAVIQPREGEHPFEAYKRLTGVINSIHTPEITPAPDDAACGVVGLGGKVKPFPATA